MVLPVFYCVSSWEHVQGHSALYQILYCSKKRDYKALVAGTNKIIWISVGAWHYFPDLLLFLFFTIDNQPKGALKKLVHAAKVCITIVI